MTNTAAAYARKVEMPANLREGFANQAQIAVNCLAEGNDREATLQLVDLIDTLRGCIGKRGLGDGDRATTGASIPLEEHDRQIKAAKGNAYRKGYEAGRRAMKEELAQLLGQAVA